MPATKRIEPPGEASETKPRPHPWPGPMIYTPLTATKGALLASIASSEAARTVEALALWRVVFGDERGILHIWTGIRDVDGNIPSATIRFDNFAYPSAATSAAEWALAKSDEGREVYFCAHLLASTRPLEGRKSPRVKENAATLAALYAELDGAKLPAGDLEPPCVVESSPGRFHVYWPLTDAVPPEVGEAMNKRLARAIGADASGYDLTQLLRVPGTVNYKYDEKPVVRLVRNTEHRFVPSEMDALLPEAEPEQHEQAYDAEENGHEPPVRLGDAYMRIWRGEAHVLKDDGTVDRSRTLRTIAIAVARGGGSTATVRDRDEALGFHKATTRRDGGRWYRDVAAWAVEMAVRDQEATAEGNGHGWFSSSPPPPTQGSDDENQQDSTNGHDPLAGVAWFHQLGEPKPRRFIIGRVGPKRYPLVAFGAGGVAKSYVMLACGIAIASAAPGSEKWLRWPIMEHGYVCFTDFELEVEEQHRRVAALCAGMGLPVPKRLAYLSGVGLSTDEAFRRSRAFVERYKAVAVVVDSVGLALPGDMERGKDVLAFFRRYIDPLRRLGATPLLVDHEGKLQSGERHKDKSPIGSAYKSWSARSVLQFEVEEYREADATLDLRVRQTKANFAPQEKPFGVSVAFSDGKVSIDTHDLDDTEMMDEDRVPVRDRILAALAIEPRTVPALVGITGAAEGTIYNRLSEMMDAGEVVHDGYEGRKKVYRPVAGKG
jgi:hypothetical protein